MMSLQQIALAVVVINLFTLLLGVSPLARLTILAEVGSRGGAQLPDLIKVEDVALENAR